MSVRTLTQQKLSASNYLKTKPAIKGSVLFNGTDQYLEIAANSAFNFGTTDFTVEFWFKPLVKSACSPVGQDYGGGSWEFYYNWYSSNSMTFLNGDNGMTTNAETVTVNQWNHVAGVRSGSTRKLYLNGVSAPNYWNASENFNSGKKVHIGGGDPLGGFLNGYVSNVRIVLSALYTANFTPPTAPLTAITGTTFLACQGGSLVDNGPNALTITPRGALAPSVSTQSPFA